MASQIHASYFLDARVRLNKDKFKADLDIKTCIQSILDNRGDSKQCELYEDNRDWFLSGPWNSLCSVLEILERNEISDEKLNHELGNSETTANTGTNNEETGFKKFMKNQLPSNSVTEAVAREEIKIMDPKTKNELEVDIVTAKMSSINLHGDENWDEEQQHSPKKPRFRDTEHENNPAATGYPLGPHAESSTNRQFDDASDVQVHRQVESTEPSNIQHKIKLPSGRTVVYIYTSDITCIRVEAIVNAANSCLLHGGGVAGAIAKMAGYALTQESTDYVSKYGEVKTGNAAVTSAGNLPYRCVIHAVGPMWADYMFDTKMQAVEDLYNAFSKCLQKADDLKISTIGLPAISGGIYAVPREIVTNTMYDAILNHDAVSSSSTLKEIHLVNVDDTITKAIASTFVKRGNHAPEPCQWNPQDYIRVREYNSYPGNWSRGGRGRGRGQRGRGQSQFERSGNIQKSSINFEEKQSKANWNSGNQRTEAYPTDPKQYESDFPDLKTSAATGKNKKKKKK